MPGNKHQTANGYFPAADSGLGGRTLSLNIPVGRFLVLEGARLQHGGDAACSMIYATWNAMPPPPSYAIVYPPRKMRAVEACPCWLCYARADRVAHLGHIPNRISRLLAKHESIRSTVQRAMRRGDMRPRLRSRWPSPSLLTAGLAGSVIRQMRPPPLVGVGGYSALFEFSDPACPSFV